jgi:hypothetical protein
MKRLLALISTLVLFAVAFLIQGCDYIPSPQEIQKLRSEIGELKNEIELLKIDSAFFRGSIEGLSKTDQDVWDSLGEHYRQLVDLETRLNRFDSATFDFGEKGFQRLDCEAGFFLVVVEDAKPFANGVKVSLRIGNPHNASFSNLTLKVKWGKSMPKRVEGAAAKNWGKDYIEWKKSLTEKEFTFPETLRGGDWNYVELRLPNTKIDELGHLELSIGIKTVSLRMTMKK